jgi:hypothetical protein
MITSTYRINAIIHTAENHRAGQQAPPHTTYPAGQADAGVTDNIVANIIASIPKILIVRMPLS